MKIKLQFKSWHCILLLYVLVFCQNSNAQCTDNSIRPSDGFNVSPWAPRCNNGNDGEIRISGISSTGGSGNFTNRGYSARVISGPNGPMTFPIPSNASDVTLTGLSAGAYVIDIIDQCGGNSADKTVSIPNPASNIPTIRTVFIFKDRLTNPTLTGCGNILKYALNINSLGTSGNITYVLTNNNGQTLTFTKVIPRVADALIHVYAMDIEIPLAFFNGGNLSYTGSNLCGAIAGGVIEKPAANDIVYGTPSLRDVADPSNECNMGYDIKVFREFMTNPVTVSVEETAHPGVTALNFFESPINPQTVNLLHINSVPMAFATQVSLGLKYNTHYTIKFTDACGLTVVKSMIQNVEQFSPSFSCGTYITVSDVDGYFEDTALLKYNCVAIASKAVGPLNVTINSGPTTYSTSSGIGNNITSSTITYPYSTTLSSPFLDTYLTIDNLRTFPSGSYNFTVTDACGKTSTFDVNAPCSRNFNISHTLQSCGSVNENVNVQITVPKAIYGTRATIYKTDGSIALTGIINFGAPFYFNQLATSGTLNVSLPNNFGYSLRYGGVNVTGQLSEPTQFGGVGALPRLTGGYLYEYNFRVELQQFRFASIEACGSTVNMTATGGVSPYTFTLLDGSGTTQLFPNQTSATFSGLVTGTIYTAKATDNCGREFTQQFEVFPFPVPFIGNVTNPTCVISGSVQINNLPSDWTIIQTPGGNTYTGTTNSYTITGLPSGNYVFSIRDNITLCRDNESLNASLLPRSGCPIAIDDVADYNVGMPISVNVLANDTAGDLVNPRTASLVPNSNSRNIITDSNGDIISMTIPGEGVWTINRFTGQARFTPASGFTETPTSVEYNVEDYNGNTSNNAVIKIDILPIAIDDTSAYTTGNPVIMQIVNNDTAGDRIDPTTVSLIIPETPAEITEINGQINRLVIPREGAWQVNRNTGAATFIPETGFTGVPSQQRYTVRDFEGNLSNIALITLTQACHFEVLCPTFNVTTVSCYTELPSATELTISEFESVGNSDGRINNTYCGLIEIKAENSPYTGCGSDITRTYTITEFQDGNGNGRHDSDETTILNTMTCSQIIRIEDRTAPVFVGALPANVTIECNSEAPLAARITATDNCGNASVTFHEEFINGNCSGEAEIIRTWTATDECGNENSYSQTISIRDTTPPAFLGEMPLENISADCSKIPSAPVLTATDNCSSPTLTYEETQVEGDCKSKYQLIRKWTATDSCGNASTYTQTVNLTCHIQIYNAVSPDGDGRNDIFYLEGIECFPNNSVEIFNRWGNKVFETEGYDNTAKVFRGKSEGKNTISANEELPSGTYYYVLKYDFNIDGNDHENIEKAGYLYIVNK